jgi:hypothetical protein
MPTDGAHIKLVEEHIRPGKPNITKTICVFEWIAGHLAESDASFHPAGLLPEPEWVEAHWVVRQKPESRKQERQLDAEYRASGIAFPRHGPSPRCQDWLEVPGFVVRWEKVTPVLDKLADAGVTTCKVSELRTFVQRS